MTNRVLKLYPGEPQETPLRGTYLAHGLHRLGTVEIPFVYADFISSLDGRIALDDPGAGTSHLPAALRNDADFRLLLELQAQADCVVTHGGYLRAVADRRLDDILRIGARDENRDLAGWRRDNGLPPQPAVVIASASLDFPIPPSLSEPEQRVLIATGASAPVAKVEELRARGYEVIIAGKAAHVEGAPLTHALGARGFHSIFLLAGPRMLETMIRDRMLSRLYLTITHSLLGGESFHTLLSGPPLGAAGKLHLSQLLYDTGGGASAGQWFAQFETVLSS